MPTVPPEFEQRCTPDGEMAHIGCACEARPDLRERILAHLRRSADRLDRNAA